MGWKGVTFQCQRNENHSILPYRNVRFGLSQLKFFTQPPASKTRNAQLANSNAESEDVVLNIVSDKPEEDSNKLIGAVIKTAAYRTVDRAKRTVVSFSGPVATHRDLRANDFQ